MKANDIVSINFPSYREGKIVLELPFNQYLIVWQDQKDRLISGPYHKNELSFLYHIDTGE